MHCFISAQCVTLTAFADIYGGELYSPQLGSQR